MKTVNQNPHFFIVGCPRSGTTMLASLLSKHSRIAIPPETHFFIETFKKGKDNNLLTHLELINILFSNLRIQDLHIDEIEFEEYFTENYAPTYKELFRALSEFYVSKNKKEIFGEKTPNHIYHIDEILALFPSAKVLIITRDGRDVVMSLKKVPWIHNDVRRLSYIWKKAIDIGDNFSTEYKENIMQIKYEDILLSTENSMREILSFLEIKYEGNMLKTNSTVTVMPKWEKSWKSNINKNIDKNNANKWVKNSNKKEKCIMNFVMKKELIKYNYKIHDDECKLIEQLKNFLYNLIFDTKILSFFKFIKATMRFVGYKKSITSPEMNVNQFLKGKYNEKQ